MNEKGFTLIESLLVLAVLMIITILSSHIAMKINEHKVIEQFFNQLELDILAIQSYSIEKNSIVNITFLQSSNTYKAQHYFGEILFERKLPENLKLSKNSYLNKIEFSSGKIRNFGTLTFNLKDKEVSFIVYIERGRTRFVES